MDPRPDRFRGQEALPSVSPRVLVAGIGMQRGLGLGVRGLGCGWGWGWALVHCRSICALCRKVVNISAVYVRNEWQNWISSGERKREKEMEWMMRANEMPANNSCKFYERKYNSNGH